MKVRVAKAEGYGSKTVWAFGEDRFCLNKARKLK